MYKILTPRFRSRCLEVPQPDFAAHFNRSIPAVSRWINNPEKISFGQFLAICDFINAEPDEFYEKEN